jgi:hypothetical protein
MKFSGAAQATQLNAAIDASVRSLTLEDGASYPSSNFVIVIDRGTPIEEKVFVGLRSANVCTECVRGYDGTSPAAHGDNAVVQHTLPASWCQKIDDLSEGIFGTDVALLETVCPAGTIRTTVYGVADPGWLLFNQRYANGQTRFPTLWPKLPVTWKQGTDIVLPDWSDRTLQGVGVTAVGEKGGANARTIAEANLPPHRHDIGHGHGDVTGPAGAHTPAGSVTGGGEHGHNISDPGHGHNISDPGHSHSLPVGATDRIFGLDDNKTTHSLDITPNSNGVPGNFEAAPITGTVGSGTGISVQRNGAELSIVAGQGGHGHGFAGAPVDNHQHSVAALAGGTLSGNGNLPNSPLDTTPAHGAVYFQIKAH